LRIVIDESDVQLKKHSTQRMQQNCELWLLKVIYNWKSIQPNGCNRIVNCDWWKWCTIGKAFNPKDVTELGIVIDESDVEL
jgi:hypothetical protein